MVSVRSCTNSPTQDTQEETGVSRSQTRKITQKFTKRRERTNTLATDSRTHTHTQKKQVKQGLSRQKEAKQCTQLVCLTGRTTDLNWFNVTK